MGTKFFRSLIGIAALAVLAAAVTPPGVSIAADLTVQTVTEAGITPTYAAASTGGDKFSNGAEDVICHFKNKTSATSITVSIPANDTTREATGLGPVTKEDGGGAIAGGAEAMVGPFPRLAFNGSDGKVSVSYSANPSVCQGGTNAGAACTVTSECPGSSCAAAIQVGCFRVPRTR